MPEAKTHPHHAIGTSVVQHINSGVGSDAPLWDAHYHPDFESVEGDGTTHKGRDEVQGKHDWWYGAHTVHAIKAHGPYLGPGGFSVVMEMDLEPKDGSWPRMQMQEVGVYTVNDNKVVREEFHTPPMGG